MITISLQYTEGAFSLHLISKTPRHS